VQRRGHHVQLVHRGCDIDEEGAVHHGVRRRRACELEMAAHPPAPPLSPRAGTTVVVLLFLFSLLSLPRSTTACTSLSSHPLSLICRSFSATAAPIHRGATQIKQEEEAVPELLARQGLVRLWWPHAPVRAARPRCRRDFLEVRKHQRSS
jgi:hypothetical protein